jgi:hypothetical protein
MTWSYQLDTDIGGCRRTIPAPIFSDEEITSFVADEGDWRRGAALALETIATDEALVQKVQTIAGFQTNGATLAKALMDRAALLRLQANQASEDSGAAFDIAEQVSGPFSYRDRLLDQALRQVS